MALALKPLAKSSIVLEMLKPPQRPAVMAAMIKDNKTLSLNRHSAHSTMTETIMGLKRISIFFSFKVDLEG